MSDTSNESGNAPAQEKKPGRPAASKQPSKSRSNKKQPTSQEKRPFASRRVWPD